MSEYDWLQELKPGDEVIQEASGASTVQVIKKVTHVTPKQIVIGPTRYRRSDGWEISSESVYWRTHIREATPEAKERVEKETRRRKQLKLIESVKWRDLNGEALEAVCRVLALHGAFGPSA